MGVRSVASILGGATFSTPPPASDIVGAEKTPGASRELAIFCSWIDRGGVKHALRERRPIAVAMPEVDGMVRSTGQGVGRKIANALGCVKMQRERRAQSRVKGRRRFRWEFGLAPVG